MYQVDTDRLSVLVEATGNTTSAIGARIATLGNASASLGQGNIWANATTVTSTTGFKIA
jgi:F0F1-type ATP synthase membrane subunit c/vacuolar-type H+-ATPase subunit K